MKCLTDYLDSYFLADSKKAEETEIKNKGFDKQNKLSGFLELI